MINSCWVKITSKGNNDGLHVIANHVILIMEVGLVQNLLDQSNLFTTLFPNDISVECCAQEQCLYSSAIVRGFKKRPVHLIFSPIHCIVYQIKTCLFLDCHVRRYLIEKMLLI